ncbi:hypothetical protein APS47_10245 [Leptospira kirschneri serovar Mozdok]|nr:hypothetical protein [Leptospira kirschneri]KPZ77561.1 hypothetical protein APS47_10245 [Leptospira kirschneri serovar Mozdok]
MRFFGNVRFYNPFLFQFVILGVYLHKLYLKFLSFCPIKNFLTWDPNARLVTSIRFAEAFRSLDLIEILRLTFDLLLGPY